jgi:hypothetical protein
VEVWQTPAGAIPSSMEQVVQFMDDECDVSFVHIKQTQFKLILSNQKKYSLATFPVNSSVDLPNP